MERAGTHGFFRSELHLEEKMRKKRTSALALEMSICSEWLHITHGEFERLPHTEKLKWYAFAEARSEYYAKQEKEREMERRASQSAAKARSMTGRHR